MIIKWTVSPRAEPTRQEYCKETEHFYMHARGRGRDAKGTVHLKYFDSEADALEYIRQREESKLEQKRIDQIKRHAVELLEALEIAEERLLVAEHHLDLGEDDSINFEHAILTARAAIAKAKGQI